MECVADEDEPKIEEANSLEDVPNGDATLEGKSKGRLNNSDLYLLLQNSGDTQFQDVVSSYSAIHNVVHDRCAFPLS